jgi:hypothetical protein
MAAMSDPDVGDDAQIYLTLGKAELSGTPRLVCPTFGIPRRLCRSHILASRGAASTRTKYFVDSQVRHVGSGWR